ncbi:Bifunctional heparan sulfate N-deacetylase/N-sulfotransferase [Trichinella murrelli]|uniref:[heparan sulfate]-glucosamine N-sulfotransferase n=1 Tax=Trichinella murrelli TaxID=144512 RepID=A0A0V0TR59_9BILA|nr:Bifunctional heparan sulfate N-deacetylase/N-sulfotransferase [Trichinella murrelli]
MIRRRSNWRLLCYLLFARTLKYCTVRRQVWFLFLAALITCYFGYQWHGRFDVAYSPVTLPFYNCPANALVDQTLMSGGVFSVPREQFNSKCDSKILLLVENQYSALGQQIKTVLNYLKVPYKVQAVRKTLPSLTNLARGRYMIIIFENFYRYINMNHWNRQLLDKYCKEFGASIVAFMPNKSDDQDEFDPVKLLGFPLYVQKQRRFANASLSDISQLLYIAKRGSHFPGPVGNSSNWVGFQPNHSTYKPVMFARDVSNANDVQSLVLLDNGEFDGIRRLLFGNDLNSFWPLKLLFLDGLRFLSFGKVQLPLVRYLQIDIDDIFVGQENGKITKADVEELLRSQERMKKHVANFVYNLGFCGRFYGRGNDLDRSGDEMLIEKAADFRWFPHQWRHAKAHQLNSTVFLSQMLQNLQFAEVSRAAQLHWFPHSWGHMQAHWKTNVTELLEDMNYNEGFAKQHDIPVQWSYAVSPHHSGVYPVHDPLYDAWKSIWKIRVTSTEQYPHLKPASLRRGFVYKDIMVMPRQTCGLYTHTIFIEQFPGGKERLDESIFGGELFYTFVFNPFLIFMTHQANYAKDRLAVYTFENAVRFIRCWTNLKLQTIATLEMAEKYFQMYPQEVNPVWGNPCSDQRHAELLSTKNLCKQFPDAIIVGPQKTGSTALYTFLKLHPLVNSSLSHPKTFEEVQFFCGRNYLHGINAYSEYFPPRQEKTLLFEKSATYFDCDLAPLRVHSLLPRAKIIMIVISPIKRAYSWFQHMKAHNDPTALKNDFIDVLQSKENGPPEMWKFRQRCLTPGHYAHHIEHWLAHFPAKQVVRNFFIHIVDGEALQQRPAVVMTHLLDFLELPDMDYNEKLVYNTKKGFFCIREEFNRTRCLGKSKGRSYSPPSEDVRRYLINYYKTHNIAFHRLLLRLGYETPTWLQQELQESST